MIEELLQADGEVFAGSKPSGWERIPFLRIHVSPASLNHIPVKLLYVPMILIVK
jgi:hypothetical protein